MDEIIDSFVRAGYYRARISNLSDFDKIIGGMAWAMQLFSYDINIDVFYADSLDLGQKIGLTERLVMVLIALRCPYRLEPHQIVGLDYANMLPAIGWLLKRSEEVRREHAAFNRLLALRHYHRVTNTMQRQVSSLATNSASRHIVSVAHLEGASGGRSVNQLSQEEFKLINEHELLEEDKERQRTSELLASISDNFKDNKLVSFVNLATVLRATTTSNQTSRSLKSHGGSSSDDHTIDVHQDEDEDEDEDEDDDKEQLRVELASTTCFTDVDAKTSYSEGANEMSRVELHKRLDLELLATNQKILNLLKKFDLMPGQLEIGQYQRRYIELHQQLISKNKEVKKVFDLYNSLDVERHYLKRELSLIESIGDNLHLTNNSAGNRHLLMRQLESIIVKIQSIRDEMGSKVENLRQKCGSLNEEYARMAAVDR